MRHISGAKRTQSRPTKTALKVILFSKELMSLFAARQFTSVSRNSRTRVSAVTKHMSSYATEEDTVFLARQNFAGELRTLNRRFPNTGFGIALQTQAGDEYLLANARMPLPTEGARGFPSGRRVARLENGNRFRSIEILADAESLKSVSPSTEAEILGNALEIIARIDNFGDSVAARPQPDVAATGTGG